MNVTAIIVTRGDVDLVPIFESLPREWETIVWDNSPIQPVAPMYGIYQYPRVVLSGPRARGGDDLSVYGRYAAIEYASHDLIYVQDDDVIVSDPEAIAKAWVLESARLPGIGQYQGIVANMPQEFRHDGYHDSCLVGFGACFHRDLPARAFERMRAWNERDVNYVFDEAWFERTCDVVFTTLTPFGWVDVPRTNLPYATDENRMYRQPDHVGERQRMLELARRVRDSR